MQVLIDGDILVYRCGFAAERTEYAVRYRDDAYDEDVVIWAESHKGAQAIRESLEYKGLTPEVTPHVNLEPVQNALYNVRSMIGTALEDLQTNEDEVVICLSGPDNFREELATLKPYKGNRDPDHKPRHGPAIKEYMCKHWAWTLSDNEEADDVMGYLQYAAWQEDPFDSVIVTVDKDLDMIPGLHYNPVKRESYFVSEEQANALFWTQLLSGDGVDNIPGIPGVGKVKAAKAMEEAWHWSAAECFDEEKAYEIALALYVQSYGEEDAYKYLLENGRLIWIRRQKDELWTPQPL